MCLVDEVDAKPEAPWPYELLLPFLDVNLERGGGSVFVLAGSSGATSGSSRSSIAARPRCTPNLDRISNGYPFTELQTPGLAVGLPEGQMGNSEVGHTNIGAGRIVYQDLVRINRACESGRARATTRSSARPWTGQGATARRFHLLGLVSPGGVHSSMEHLYCAAEGGAGAGPAQVYIHAFLDGRDTPPQSGAGLRGGAASASCARTTATRGSPPWAAATTAWTATSGGTGCKLAYDAWCTARAPRRPDALAAIRASYAEKVHRRVRPAHVIVRATARRWAASAMATW